VRLRHEVWGDDGGYEFTIASKARDELRAVIAPSAEMLHVIYASSWEEAMTAYHAWQGWEAYKPIPGITDQPYDEAFLQEQGIEISRE